MALLDVAESADVAREAPAPPPSRDQLRSRRKRVVRARTVSMKRMTQRELEVGRALYPDDPELPRRPATRAECKDGPRPCPFVSCEYHLYLDVQERTGAIKLNFPDLEVWELAETCVLDVAVRGATLERAAEIMNLTRERVRQVEVKALAKLEAIIEARLSMERDELTDRRALPKRRLPILPTRDR